MIYLLATVYRIHCLLSGFRISALRDRKSETSRVRDLILFAVLSLPGLLFIVI